MAEYIRISILGTLPGGEVWTVNPCFFMLNSPVDVTAAQITAIATAADNVVMPTGLRDYMSTSTFWTGVRAEARGRTGLLEAQSEHSKVTPVPGSGTFAHPYQTAAVTSLRSNFPGASGRGRLFWPATGIQLSTPTLRVTAANAGTFLTGVRTFLTGIEAAVTASVGTSELSVYSRKGTAFHKIVRMQQGDILDTQRRRRDALAEVYSVLTYPT